MASSDNQMPKPKIIGIKRPDVAYNGRFAVRVVALKATSEVVVIYVKNGNYFKLPGGGVEIDEDHHNAAQREVKEETGAVVSLRKTNCIATTEEFRNDLHQISYCYFADVIDTTGSPSLTEEERADGLSHRWMPIDNALEAMTAVKPTSELGCYVKERDIYLLIEAKNTLGREHSEMA